jgi:hypothetical protein
VELLTIIYEKLFCFFGWVPGRVINVLVLEISLDVFLLHNEALVPAEGI